MTTVIVPTDFSAVANNAAVFSAKMLTGQYDAQMILFHVYEKAADKAEAERQLDQLKTELQSLGIVKIECKAQEGGDFIDQLERLSRHLNAALVVMGITGKSKLVQVFLGSNTLKMVERNVCPVLIIPPTAQFSQVKNAALLSDFKQVESTIPVVPIRNVLSLLRPSLHIINVDSNHYVSLTEEVLTQRSSMQEMFRDFNPEFYFIGTFDLHETVQQFTADKGIDMLITIPKNHSFFGSLFRSSNTKKLVYESTIPILAAHE
jgi:nucleotide-binding universal stress UspA family protein